MTPTSAYTEESFNRCLDLLNIQTERAEMWKGAFTAMESYRDFWRKMYKETESEYAALRARVESMN